MRRRTREPLPPIRMRFQQGVAMRTICFPDYEGECRVDELSRSIAAALGTRPRKAINAVVEILIPFKDYAESFALHWNAHDCDLGCHAGAVDLDAIAEKLVASDRFVMIGD